MNMVSRLLILDDLFGRTSPAGSNFDRENLCAHFLWLDTTGDSSAKASRQKILQPTAEAVFCRAQTPACSVPGDTLENDLEMALEAVRKGWKGTHESRSLIRDSGRADQPRGKTLKSEIRNQKSDIPWSMVLIDLCFYTGQVTEESHRRTPGMPEGRPGDDNPRSYFGLTLLDAVHREFPEIPIFILSSKPREEVSLEFSRRGALGFIDRSALDGPELLQQALWNHGLLPDSTGEIVGNSLPILLALREARRSASHQENILIRGERGSGKELIARYINRANPRSLNPESRFGPEISNQESTIRNSPSLVTVNSAVFTPNLFSSELFGIEPRTATGVDGKVGLLEMANGGDIFLDEIADMPTEIQAAMLRVLQERQITRVGARKTRDIDVRFLSATNRDLDDHERKFRPDLLDRLRTGGTIWLPPLRDRKEDIPLLAYKFVGEAEAQRIGIRHRSVTNDAMDALMEYDWPGNIRELRSVIFDAVTRHPDVEHLVPAHLRLGGGIPDSGSLIPESKSGVVNSPQFDGLLDTLRKCEFAADEVGRWAGRLPELQREYSKLIARLLRAAVKATKRRTPENPEGLIQIHPAAKLATGDTKLTATEAADLFKRLLGLISDELDGDLSAAYNTALRLRPKVRPVKLEAAAPK